MAIPYCFFEFDGIADNNQSINSQKPTINPTICKTHTENTAK